MYVFPREKNSLKSCSTWVFTTISLLGAVSTSAASPAHGAIRVIAGAATIAAALLRLDN